MNGFLDWLYNAWLYVISIEDLWIVLVGILGLTASVVWIVVKVSIWLIKEIFDPVWGYEYHLRARIRAERQAIKEEKKRKKSEAKYWAEIEKKYNS